MYKEAYTMMKRADWWKDFNDFADQNQWVRPAIGTAAGAGIGTGIGALTGARNRKINMLLMALAGGGLGFTGGSFANMYSNARNRARAKAEAQRKMYDQMEAQGARLDAEAAKANRLQDAWHRQQEKKIKSEDQAPKEIQQANDFYNAQQEAQAKGRSSKNKNTVQNSPSKNDEQQAQLRQQQRHIDAMTAEQQKRDMLNSGKIKQSPRAESNTYSQGLAQIQQANDFYNAQQQAQGRRGNSGKRNKSILDSKFPLIYNWLYDIPESSRRSGFYNMVDAIGDDPNQAQYDQTRALYDSMRNRGLGYLLRH